MDSRFEITIVLSLILAILTVVFAYRKKTPVEFPVPFTSADYVKTGKEKS